MRTPLTVLCVLGALISASMPVAAAQETGSGSLSASGQIVMPVFSLQELQRQEIPRQWEARIARSENFRQAWLQEKTFVKAMQINDEEYRKRRAARRQECRSDIRKASKIGKLSVSLECYREELADALDRLQKQREYIERMPGVSDDVRWLTLMRLDLLGDALNVIVNAIDSDVYQSVEELEEAKQNLLISYRQPLWLMETRLRADKLLTWTASLMTRIGAMGQENLDGEDSKRLYEGVACLNESEALLKTTVAAQELSAATQKLADAQAKLQDCITLIRGDDVIDTAEEEQVVEVVEIDRGRVPQQQELTSRRVQRRLTRQVNLRLTRVPNDHGAATDEKPVDTSMMLGNDTRVTVTCNGQPISRRLQRRIGETCNIANQ